jgi:DHA2 family multidrug resistance protein-like MFS transporter
MTPMTTLEYSAAAHLERATRREWIGLAILALPCILYAMDLTVLNLAVPALSVDLKPTAAQLLWIVDIYGFFAAGSLVIMGALGDRIGRRKLLLIGTALFGIVSLAAAFAHSAGLLILARALLGIAGATMAPSTLSLISNMFRDDRQRAFAVSIWVASFSFGGAVGPVVGGLVLAHFWWGAVFLAPLPVIVLLLMAGPGLLPEHRDPSSRRLDVISAVLSLAAVLPVVYGIKLAAEGGSPLPAAAAVCAGLLFGGLFARRQLRLAEPLLDLKLFQRPAVTIALAINSLDFCVGFGILVLIAQYLQLVLGLTPLQAGFATMAAGLGFVVGSLLTSPILKLMRPAYLLAFGFAVGACGLAVMAHAVDDRSLVLVVLGNCLFSIGTAPGISIVADFVVSAAPQEQSGAAAALSETASEFGGALGIALLGSLATFVYRATLGASMPPGSSLYARATALRGIGAASSLAQSIGGDALQLSARMAFTDAMRITLFIASGIMLLLAIVAATMFRTAKTSR